MSYFYGFWKSLLAVLFLTHSGDPTDNTGKDVEEGGTFYKLYRYLTVKPLKIMTRLQVMLSLAPFIYPNMPPILKGIFVNSMVVVSFFFYGGDRLLKEKEETSQYIWDAKHHTHLYKHFSLFLSSLFLIPWINFGDNYGYRQQIVGYTLIVIAYLIGSVVNAGKHGLEYAANIAQLYVYSTLKDFNNGLYLLLLFLTFHNFAILVDKQMNTRLNDEANHFIYGNRGNVPISQMLLLLILSVQVNFFIEYPAYIILTCVIIVILSSVIEIIKGEFR